VHVSEMSWSKRVKHPSKLVGPGDAVEVEVLGVDPKARRISLGSGLYSRLMGDLQKAATQLAAGDLAGATAGGMAYGELTKLVSDAS